jgi:hypothetical protein
VIVVNKFSDGRPKVPFAEQDHSRQALAPDRADKALGKGIQIRTSATVSPARHCSAAGFERQRIEWVAVENHIVRVAETPYAGNALIQPLPRSSGSPDLFAVANGLAAC